MSDAGTSRWGLGDALGGAVVATVLSGVGVVAAAVLQGHGDRTLLVALAALAGLWTGLAGTAFLAARRKGSGRVSVDFGLRVRPGDVPVGLLAGVGSQLVLVPLVYLPFRLLDPDAFRKLGEDADELFDLASGPGLALLAVLVVVGAPLVEELFYRGLLQRSLARRFGPGWAVPVTAVVFAAMHYQPLTFPGLVAFGAVLGVLAQRRGHLGTALVAHVAFNATTVALLLVL